MREFPDGLHGYTPFEALEVRVQHAADRLCDFDPDAAAYRQRTEAWVRLVLEADDRRERELNPQYADEQAWLDAVAEVTANPQGTPKTDEWYYETVDKVRQIIGSRSLSREAHNQDTDPKGS